MAWLGRYYADKIRGAANLAVYRQDPGRKEAHEQAVRYLTDAVSKWEHYAASATRQYDTQLFARTHYMDWFKILDDVKAERDAVANETPSEELRSMAMPRGDNQELKSTVSH